MQNHDNSTVVEPKHAVWNKGKLIGAKPPLRPKHVWSIRTKLQIDDQVRDLALFNLSIDSKLRGCDVVTLKVEDIAPNGYAVARAIVRQKKTGRPVRFELTEQTRQSGHRPLMTLRQLLTSLMVAPSRGAIAWTTFSPANRSRPILKGRMPRPSSV